MERNIQIKIGQEGEEVTISLKEYERLLETEDRMNRQHNIMVLTRQEKEKFDNVFKPLIKYLAENRYPHIKVIVDCDSAEILESSGRYVTDNM